MSEQCYDDDLRALRVLAPAPDVEQMSDAALTRVEHRVRRQVTTVAPARGTARRVRVGALVAVAAAALVAVPLLLGPAGDTGRDRSGDSGGASDVLQLGAAPAAAQVLDDASAAAAARQTAFVAPRADQWVYVRSRLDVLDPVPGMDPVAPEERWLSQQPDAANGTDVYRRGGRTVPIEVGEDATVPASILRPTVQWLARLPTEPAALQRRLRSDLVAAKLDADDSGLFGAISSLMSQNLVPPRVQAALYQVGKRIPGVTSQADVRDAEGRSGIGITLGDSDGDYETWIFSRRDLTFLGSRDSTLMAYPHHKTVRVDSTYAVLQRAVVDRRLQRP